MASRKTVVIKTEKKEADHFVSMSPQNEKDKLIEEFNWIWLFRQKKYKNEKFSCEINEKRIFEMNCLWTSD